MEDEVSELKLVPPNDPALRTPVGKFDFSQAPIHPVELYRMMGQEMIRQNSVGLACNQVGLPYNFFVLRSEPILGMFNAEIVDTSDDMLTMEEGCLSWPGLSLTIVRPQVIRIRYTIPSGERFTKKFQDMTARIVQHELDHIHGIPFGRHVSRLNLEMAIKKAQKLGYKYKIGDVI